MISPYQDRQFQQLRKVIFDKYCNFLLEDQELIQRQVEVMEECKQKMERRRAYESLNNISLNITNISSIHNLSNTEESSFRNKFTQQFENSILNAALKQVRSYCSDETFDTIIGYVMNNKNKQYEQAKREIEKRVKQCEELSILLIIRQKDIHFLERDLNHLKVKEEFLQDEKKKLKKRIDQLDEKEKRLHSAEMSLIFKEKLNLQGKRRYERQKDIHDTFSKKLQKIYGSLDLLWSSILQKMLKSQCSCDKNCWRHDVMKKCKEQLVQQRKILQEEEKQIQSQYQTLRNLSDQVKKAFVGLTQENARKPQDITNR